VKLPPPVHPELIPVSVHVPVIVLLFTFPVNVKVLPLGDPERMVNPKRPLTLPLKSPLRENDPVCVSPETKHGDDVVNVKLVMLKPLAAIWLKVVLNAKAGVPSVLVSVATQLPLILPLEFGPPPHPLSIKPRESSRIIPNDFIRENSFPNTNRLSREKLRSSLKKALNSWGKAGEYMQNRLKKRWLRPKGGVKENM
jgi:hypothetical protein